MTWLDQVLEDHGGPDGNIDRSASMGKSYGGRDIYGYVMHESGFEWTRDNRPGILIDCGIHSREWISPAACRLFIHEMMRCSGQDGNPGDCGIVFDEFFEFNWFIVPILNPDGYVYTWTGMSYCYIISITGKLF